MLGRPHKISRKLRRGEACAFPFGDRFTFLLERLFHHQIHRFFLVHVPGVNALIENRIGNGA